MRNKIVLYWILLSIFCVVNKSHSKDKQEDIPIIKFGIIADIQYCNEEPSGSRFYRNSLAKLDSCIIDFNKNKVQFSVILGDLVDRDTYNNLDSVLIRLKKMDRIVYNTTGNHDYGGITNNTELYTKLNMPAEYYAFSKDKWVFIILNTNEIASYSTTKNTDKELEYIKMIQKSRDTERSNDASYNGGISQKQMQWLKKELDRAQQSHKNVFIFTHHPLYGIRGLTALNDIEIIELLFQYSCVKCVLSGHHHAGAFGVYNRIPFITTEGMVETEKENAYGFVEIYKDRIEFIGKGRSKSHSILFHKK